MIDRASILERVRSWRSNPQSASKDEILNVLAELGYQQFPAHDFREVMLCYPPGDKTHEWRRFQFMTSNPHVPLSRITLIAEQVERYLEGANDE